MNKIIGEKGGRNLLLFRAAGIFFVPVNAKHFTS